MKYLKLLFVNLFEYAFATIVSMHMVLALMYALGCILILAPVWILGMAIADPLINSYAAVGVFFYATANAFIMFWLDDKKGFFDKKGVDWYLNRGCVVGVTVMFLSLVLS